MTTKLIQDIKENALAMKLNNAQRVNGYKVEKIEISYGFAVSCMSSRHKNYMINFYNDGGFELCVGALSWWKIHEEVKREEAALTISSCLEKIQSKNNKKTLLSRFKSFLTEH